jgi:hypothetical protein
MKRSQERVPGVGKCGVCGRWTERGDWFASGQRDPRTGNTPCDNFICDRCQQEARVLREVDRALDQRERRRKAA